MSEFNKNKAGGGGNDPNIKNIRIELSNSDSELDLNNLLDNTQNGGSFDSTISQPLDLDNLLDNTQNGGSFDSTISQPLDLDNINENNSDIDSILDDGLDGLNEINL